MTTLASSQNRSQATTLTIWLQEDARDNWPGVVNATNAAFERSHPGVNVKVEYQTWNQHLVKFDAAIAANNVPDVIEMGNTEMTKYMDAKAFFDITSQKSSIPNSRTWLKGLGPPPRLNGRLYGVPYYAGARAVIYRKDLYRGAGIRKLPTSLAEYEAVNRKLMKKYGSDRRFSALYFPGQYWLAAMSFVYDYGGAIARFRNGRWVGTLDSPQAIRALTKVKSMVRRFSRASKTGDEANPFQAVVFGQGEGRAVELVRADREELGERRERTRDPDDARAHRQRQAQREERSAEGQPSDHVDPERKLLTLPGRGRAKLTS